MKQYWKKTYLITMSLLAIISILLVILDISKYINITNTPYSLIDNGILAIFAIDYFTRLAIAKNKLQFIRSNVFDLLSIIPFSSAFALFRITRVTRVARLARVIRLAGLTGRLKGNLSHFFKINGLWYVSLMCIVILLISSVAYSITEKVSFVEAIWWSIATTTTVGYGDISPHTIIGKVIATILMLVGIGFVGMFTSSVMTFFSEKEDDASMKLVLKKLEKIEQENSELKLKIDKLVK